MRQKEPGKPENGFREKESKRKQTSEETRKFYDEAFIEVFSNRTIIESLLKDFVDEPWVNEIDFDSMTIERSVFKDVRNRRLENDLLLLFQTIDTAGKKSASNTGAVEYTAGIGKTFSIFVLLEFQSSVEPMLLRLLEYLARIYKQQYNQRGKQSTKCRAEHTLPLSPVVPIVVYNGERKWREPQQFLKLFHGSVRNYPRLEQYIPDFCYFLIDENRFSDSLLKKFRNAVAYFFLIDKTDLQKREEAEERIITILWEVKEEQPELFNLLGRYISGLLRYKGVERTEITEYITERGKPMLLQSMEKLFEQAKKEGLEKGIEEGIQKGMLRDKQDTLARQLDLRFGLTDKETALIKNVQSIELLNNCLDKILFSSKKEEILTILRSS